MKAGAYGLAPQRARSHSPASWQGAKICNEDGFKLDPGRELLVRSSLTRQVAHAAGSGTWDTELMSHVSKLNQRHGVPVALGFFAAMLDTG